MNQMTPVEIDERVGMSPTAPVKPRPMTRREKLETLLAFMEKIDDKQISLDDVVRQRRGLSTPGIHCDTIACVGGWAFYVPEFRAQGLEYEMRSAGQFRASYLGTVGWGDALARFLDIDEAAACNLFAGKRDGYHVSHKDEALDRIRGAIHDDKDHTLPHWVHPNDRLR